MPGEPGGRIAAWRQECLTSQETYAFNGWLAIHPSRSGAAPPDGFDLPEWACESVG